jgi:hypothetical protein
MSDGSAVYLKIENGEKEGQIDLTLKTFRNGSLIDVEDVENGPVGIHGVYAFILMQALSNDKGLQNYMENLINDFAKYLKNQKDEEGEEGENGEK